MFRVRDFTCDNKDCEKHGLSLEQFTNETLSGEVTSEHICVSCATPLRRELSCPRINLDGLDPGFPGAYDRWAKVHETGAKDAARKNRDRNVYQMEQGERPYV